MALFKTIIEPFRIKVVEPIKQTTYEERKRALIEAKYNLFLLKAEDVLIDLLTDSGTGALSSNQWSQMMLGDESYAGARSFFRFEKTIKDITGFNHVIPAHQGRAAERILFNTILKEGDIVPNNTHFDTTRANVEAVGAVALDLPIKEGTQSQVNHPFKGNIDLDALEKVFHEKNEKIPFAMITITNNSCGGQPVSMKNIREAKNICEKYNVPLLLDACRFAENSWFIKTREEGYESKSTYEIAREMFQYADGCTMSAKKDGMANIGGFLALNGDGWANRCKDNLILTEGFVTYGGLAGYDLEAIAVGLHEALDEDYLKYRMASIEYLAKSLVEAGVPIVQPCGGHALYIDAKEMLPHIPQNQYPACSLALALYLEGGVRGCEIGSAMFAKQSDGSIKPPAMELVRLAFPRRMYTQSHVDYLAEVICHVNKIKDQIRGMKMVKSPEVLGHFSAHFLPISGNIMEESLGNNNKQKFAE